MGLDVTHLRIAQLERFITLFENEGLDPDSAIGATEAAKESLDRQTRPMAPVQLNVNLPAEQQREERLMGAFFDAMFPSPCEADDWYLDTYRQWDLLAWFFDQVDEDADAKQLAKAAVWGAEELVIQTAAGSVVARTGPDSPIMVSPPGACKKIAEFTSGISADMIAQLELPPSRASDPRAALEYAFIAIRDFYAKVADAGHAVLVDVC